MMRSMFCVGACALALLASAGASAAEPTTARLADLPVREVAIFKDGHAFVTHEGSLEVKGGAVIFEHVPEPVLGAFWPYARGRRVTLESVVASMQEVSETREAISLPELIRANEGKRIKLTVQTGAQIETVEGKNLGIPRRSVERENTVQPPQYYDRRTGNYVQPPATATAEMVEETGDIVLVQLEGGGLRTVKLASVADATFPDDAQMTYTQTVEKRRLRLNIAGGRDETTVGMTYLQKGLRWIPEYAVLLGEGEEIVLKLQGTIVNDMVDLDDVTVYLVVGVPNFAFKDQLSPIALREAAAQLSQYFQTPSQPMAYSFSNVLMSQFSGARGFDASGGPGIEQPMGTGAEALGPQEDLFLYKVEHVSLKKGERLIVPVVEVKATYKDAYTWQIPFSPPPELLQNINNDQREQMMMLSRGARVRHVLRIKNTSEVPLTTGPALLIQDGRLLAQSLITYTSVGNEVDVDVTVATDVHAKKWEKQAERKDNATVIGGHSYTRLDVQGFLELTNFKKEAVTVEVTRAVLGTVTEADNEGEIMHLNSFEDLSYLPEGDVSGWGWWYLHWWSYWPWWWHNANDIGQIKWTVTLEPGEKRTLQYTWFYYTW
jgi:hypothetical protein